MSRRPTLLALCVGAGAAPAQTVVTSSAFDEALRVVSVPTLDVVAEQPVTLEGVHVHGISALAVEPESGVLYGALREARCPGDPTRTRLARGACPEFTASPALCAEAYAINDGVPVSCFHTGTVCAPCVKANEGSGCTNTCLGTPACADAGRTWAAPPGASGAHVADVPLATGLTLYARTGDVLVVGAAALALMRARFAAIA
jgi:hypothetical protein